MSIWHKGSSLKFDPAEFNVPPSLQKGTSQRLQLYIQSAHARALDVIAHSGHFPWGKDTDVARWAIQHGIQYIDKIDKDIVGLTSLVGQANALHTNNVATMNNLLFLQSFDETQQNVLQLKGKGMNELAKDLVMKQWRTIQAMPDQTDHDAQWKYHYVNKFESMFKDMIDY